MYQRNCNCQQSCINTPEPIMAPKKVCYTQSCRYVEQPVICPIECCHVENVVYYPKYYPQYSQSYMVQDCNGNNCEGNR